MLAQILYSRELDLPCFMNICKKLRSLRLEPVHYYGSEET